MAPSVSVFCTYGKYAVVVDAHYDFSYNDLVNFVCEKWTKLERQKFYLSYGLPGCPKCMLDSEMDMKIMLSKVLPTSIDKIDVCVSKNRELYDDGCSIVRKEVALKRKRVEVDAMESERLSLACQHENKQLLTEKWRYGITGVGGFYWRYS